VRGHWALGAALLLGACADFGGPIGDAPPFSEQARLQEIEARLEDMSRRLEALSGAAQSQTRQQLEGEVRSLRGDTEKLRFDLEGTEKRNRELYRDLDRRLQRLESESQPARLSMEPRMASAPPPPAGQEEEAAYLRVFEMLKAGRYDEAIAGFRSQLERWPDGRYADNALYWTGESHYVKRDYDAAIGSFQALLSRFPASAKVPDALLKIGMAQAELKQTDAAHNTLKKVVDEYPGSNAANLARQRLNQLQ
jgi:tol-pal system protein YbgF